MSSEKDTSDKVKEDNIILMAVVHLKERSSIDLEPLLSELFDYMDNKSDGEYDIDGNAHCNEEAGFAENIGHLLFSLRKALGMKAEL